MKKKVLVYPCGTEIALEICRCVNGSTHFELFGGSSSHDHGRFVYKNFINNLPFIDDNSDESAIREFANIVKGFDFIYPAMDGVILKFKQYEQLFDAKVIAPDFETASICRSKKKTYEAFENIIKIPSLNPDTFPVFIKPDVGQGSVGARVIKNREELDFFMTPDMLVMENLTGPEFTIDCFTNNRGKLIFAKARGRKRVKGGISVNSIRVNGKRFETIARKINSRLAQRGGWFFQVKENCDGELVLLEVACRIAGTSGLCTGYGVNLPLMTLHLFNGNEIDDTIINDLEIEVDRALESKFKINIDYDKVFMDFDDTLVIDDKINLDMIAFIYQCLNEGIPTVLITRHKGNLQAALRDRKLEGIFSEIINIVDGSEKHVHVSENSIFIDDSYVERLKVKNNKKIPVFSPMEARCLLKSW